MGFRALPVIPRTARPSLTGMPVWYAEATQARTTLDINLTIPSGNSRKLIVLWGSDGGEFPTAVTFDPAGVAFPMVSIDGVFNESGDLRIAAYYLDTPPEGAKVVRIETANAVWSVASLKVYESARAGLPQATSDAATSIVIGQQMGELLLDAYSETTGLVLAAGLSEGDLTPFDGQTAGEDDVVNSSFLAVTSERTHQHNGDVSHGWTADSEVDLLHGAINILFSTGQAAVGQATPLIEWDLDEASGTFLDTYSRTNAAVQSGLASGGHDPLLADGGSSISVQGAAIQAEHHVDAQVASWSVAVYLQPRVWPASSNDAIFAKDSGLPVPGGTQIEIETDGAIDWYIRDETGLAGTAIHVTSASGDGELTLDVAHLLVATYDDGAKTAKLYHRAAGSSVTLLASKTDANFFGLQNNTSVFSLFSRAGTSGNELDGIGDRITFYSGVLTQAEIEALPAPTTITDPEAPGAIAAIDDNVGDVSPSTTTDVDVLANDTGKTGPHFDIEIVSDPAGRLSVINDQSASAQIRITTPAAPSTTALESGAYRVREGTSPSFGNPSNQAIISWRRPGTGGGGGYTPFPFVTISNPSLSHAGVAARPGYSPTDPPSASIIDPMSGIELFRVGGNLGDTLFINGTTNSGFVFPRVLRNENNSKGFKVWNADGTLLMIDRYFSRSADSGLNVAKSYLIDVSGTHGASAPWRIIRVNPTGDDLSGPAGTTAAAWWFWDPLNPLRAYAIYHDGRLAEWWPIGGPGHSEGELNVLYGEAKLPSGFSSVHGGAGRPNACTPTSDGKYRVIPCRRSSDGRWGGFRQNLFTGAIEDQFVVSPDYGGSQSFITDNNRDAKGVSELGNYTSFTPNGNRHTFKNLVTGATVSDTDPDHNTITHTCHIVRNGKEHFGGVRTNNVSLWRIETGSIEEKVTEAQFQGANPNHLGAQAWNDTFEAHGANGSGGTSGVRYLLYSRAGPRNGHPRALMGIRCGPNDLNQFRFICNHRSVRSDNSDECHPQMDPDARYVVFPTNRKETGHSSTGDGTVFPMIAALPDAWRSPNNDGS